MRRLPPRHVHAPWSTPPEVLRQAGVTLGKNYPQAILDLSATRTQALERLKAWKEQG